MPSCTASNPSHDFVLVYPLCCNDDRAGEIGRTFHFMTSHDLVLANDDRVLEQAVWLLISANGDAQATAFSAQRFELLTAFHAVEHVARQGAVMYATRP